jgi:signal transduction histidine kinase
MSDRSLARSTHESDHDPSGDGGSTRRLAHELNSRLDGALRTLRAARRATGVSAGGLDERLATVERLLLDMTSAVDRALKAPSANVASVFRSERSLGDSTRTIIAMFADLAQEMGVVLQLECDAQADALPARTLEPLLANAIRNAIEASAASTTDDSGSVVIALRCHGPRLTIDVVDNGAGLTGLADTKPTGHGLGLDIARRIAEDLGGCIELSNVPFARGAIFRAEIPIERLARREAA